MQLLAFAFQDGNHFLGMFVILIAAITAVGVALDGLANLVRAFRKP